MSARKSSKLSDSSIFSARMERSKEEDEARAVIEAVAKELDLIALETNRRRDNFEFDHHYYNDDCLEDDLSNYADDERSHFNETPEYAEIEEDLASNEESKSIYDEACDLNDFNDINNLNDVTNENGEYKGGKGREEDVRQGGSSVFGLCPKCDKCIEQEASVFNGLHFHPQCFTCDLCQKQLRGDSFYVVDQKRICEQCRQASLNQCHKCKLFIEGEFVRCPNEDNEEKEPFLYFHLDCFVCSQCNLPIKGKFVRGDNDDYICEADFLASRETCNGCGLPITSAMLRALNKVFHPECFVCCKCRQPLNSDQRFFVTEENSENEEGNKAICDPCYKMYLAKKCSACNEAIVDESYVRRTPGGCYHRQCYLGLVNNEATLVV